MNYFGDIRDLRQVFGVLILLFLISSAVFSQEEMKTEQESKKTEAASQEKKVDATTQENNQTIQTFVTKTNQTEQSMNEKSVGIRFSNSEKGQLNKSVSQNFSALRSDKFSSEGEDTTERVSFLGRNETFGKSFSKKSDESDESTITQPAQNSDPKSLRFGGHAGFVVPIYGYGNGSYSRFYDDFTFGFPVGLTLKPKGPVAIDFEFIFLSAASPNNRRFVLVIHPGVIYGFKKKYAIGVRAAYEANNNDAYGFTPLVSRSFKLTEKLNHFIEFDFPVRWNKRTVRVGNQNFNDRFLSGAWAVHYGVSF